MPARTEPKTVETLTTGAFEVVHPSGERTRIAIEPLPFRIGRGPENSLVLRDNRASRSHARISRQGAEYTIEDLDSLHGTWLNGKRLESQASLRSGDTIHFGFEESYRLVFSPADGRLFQALDQLSKAQPAGTATSLARLRVLVEMARTLQTPLASDDVIGAVLDAALVLTGAERGFLLLGSGEALEVRFGRNAQGARLDSSELHVPTAVIHSALKRRRELLFMSLGEAEQFGATEFSNVLCVPLVEFRSATSQQTLSLSAQSNTVGLLYLDSRQKQTISELNRELLHTLALEASTVLENAKLLEEERRRQRLEQELSIAREIQQSLQPSELPREGWFCAAGSNLPSADISGDYFDVRPVGSDAWALAVADVSGKGTSAALLAALLQGAFLLASELEIPLGSLMNKINRFLIDRAQGEKYATLFYATVHRSGRLEWANAGHCMPFLVRANGSVEELVSTGMPLGLAPSATYEVKSTQLGSGDKIIAYSDGVTEAENSSHEAFESRFRSAVGQAVHFSAQQIHDKVVEALIQFREGKPFRDDVTVLVAEYRGDAQ